jgi:hypothetical protein
MKEDEVEGKAEELQKKRHQVCGKRVRVFFPYKRKCVVERPTNQPPVTEMNGYLGYHSRCTSYAITYYKWNRSTTRAVSSRLMCPEWTAFISLQEE